jgi:catechol 2,3-dioxygenase-like lactoylglutathione lyase family enzyme
VDSELLLKRVTDTSHTQETAFERLHHVGVQTSNLDNCLAWYRDFFSATTTWELSEFSELTRSRLPGISRLVELRANPIRFHLFEIDPGHSEAVPRKYDQFQHCCLEVRSVDMLVRWRDRWFELFNRGCYMFASPEQATDIVEDADGVRSFYALDVNGLEYEFTWLGGLGHPDECSHGTRTGIRKSAIRPRIPSDTNALDTAVGGRGDHQACRASAVRHWGAVQLATTGVRSGSILVPLDHRSSDKLYRMAASRSSHRRNYAFLR